MRSSVLAMLVVLVITAPAPLLAEVDWVAVTIDNDIFIGDDGGFTSGLYLTLLDSPGGKTRAEPGFLARAMLWSLPESGHFAHELSYKTIGQIIVTPDNIEQDPPTLPPDDSPYAGLLFYSDTYAQVQETYADMVSVTIGVVGEYSFAEEVQKSVHEILHNDDPCCWDTQLNDEIVFQVARARQWRTWVSVDGNTDFLLGTDAELGTISSSIGASAMIRYGRDMRLSYASAMLALTRTTNPVVTQSGWFLFAGARAGYLANQIFLDGNTFDNDGQKPIDYDAQTMGVSGGLSVWWKDLSLSFAINDLNVNESNNDVAEDHTLYGSLTIAWSLD